MFATAMSNSTSLSEEASVSSGTRVQDFGVGLNPSVSTQQPQKIKKKRSLPGNPDPDAEVIALSPKTLLATNRFVCEICNKGFQRDQNLQLHRRGHNLPWKLKQRNSKEIKKKAYVCPEPSCVHHHPSRALGDLTGIKKHYCRKHGEKKWKCEKCSKIYAVQSDWKAHSKTCGTREYRCDCGTLFSRKDSFITHRAFCDALAEESARISANQLANQNHSASLFPFTNHIALTPWDHPSHPNPNPNSNDPQSHNPVHHIKTEQSHHFQIPPLSSSSQYFQQVQTQNHKALIDSQSPFQNLHVNVQPTATSAHHHMSATSAHHHMSATALLQKAATVGVTPPGQQQPQSVGHMTQLNMGDLAQIDHRHSVTHNISPATYMGGFPSGNLSTWHKTDRLTRDFLGLTGDGNGNENVNVSVNVRDVLTYTTGLEYHPNHHYSNHSLLKPQGFGFPEPHASETWGDC
ncbi:protein indeterminate-domain 12-like [Mangifera indica]|uniref:protein indeterminate-domain 12-like n=1 Tax=Mangifera indica TaxID=29780 RepID=UPI001CFB22D4|nr:protein indeterminate-domain 12-like [Mangifera indica]